MLAWWKVWLRGHEVQVDLGTGRVLQTAYGARAGSSPFMKSGSFVAGEWTNTDLVYRPVVLLLLWISGLWMWWVPVRGKTASPGESAPARGEFRPR